MLTRMLSVHDNHIVGYDVDGVARRIVLRTEFRYPPRPLEKTDVVFEGVEAYSFRHDCFGNIIFEVCERPLDDAVQMHWAEFKAGHRESGWPPFWGRNEAETRARLLTLTQAGVKWFELGSSCGMNGWVLCRSVEYRECGS